MIRIGIIGAKGYTAGELLRILVDHPEVEIAALMARVEGLEPLDLYFPALRGRVAARIEPINLALCAERCDAVFLTLPHTVAQEYAPELIERGVKVLDLSADFRFDSVELFEKTYATRHLAPELNARMPYALPELFRDQIAGAPGLAIPGCYTTASIMALAPAVIHGRELLALDQIVINALSGVSGAGRTPTEGTHFCAVNESVTAYKVGGHRHRPEIEEKLIQLAGVPVRTTFTPHLVPITRGILATCTVPLRGELSNGDALSWYREAYRQEPFVRLLDTGHVPATAATALSNFIDIGVVVDRHAQTLIVISAIDNLVKGASGQAVQAMNALFGLPETTGFFRSEVTV